MAELAPEKRLLLAFALSILVLVGWSYFMRNWMPRPQPPAEKPPATVAESARPAAVPAPPAVLSKAPPPETRATAIQGTEERLIRFPPG